MNVIGIDPGTIKLGWGIVRREGTRVSHVAHGTIKPPSKDLCDRLVYIESELSEVLRTHEGITASAVETIFFSKNAQSAAKLGHARGVIMVTLRRAGLTVGEYAPALVKRAVVGSGRADKKQVARVVMSILNLPEPPQEDAADALAVALTHLNTVRYAEALKRPTRVGRRR